MSDTEFSPDMQPVSEDLTPFDVRDSSGRQGLIKLFVGFGILLVAALIVRIMLRPRQTRRCLLSCQRLSQLKFRQSLSQSQGLWLLSNQLKKTRQSRAPLLRKRP